MTVETTKSKTNRLLCQKNLYQYPFDFTVLLLNPTIVEAREAIAVEGKYINAQLEEVLLTLQYNADFTVTLNSNGAGGYITLTAQGYNKLHITEVDTSQPVIVIKRRYEIDQESDYENYNTFPAETLEQNLDKLTMLVQQVDEKANRALILDDFTDVTPEEAAKAAIQVANNIEHIANVSDNIESVNTVNNNIDNINVVKDNIQNVNRTADNISIISNVSNNIYAVNNVSDNISDIDTAVRNLDSIKTCSDNIDNINTVADNISDVNTTAGDINSIRSVNNNLQTIRNVQDNIQIIKRVYTNEANVNNVSNNMPAINNINDNLPEILASKGYANTATQKANEAKASADSVNANLLLHRYNDERKGGELRLSQVQYRPQNVGHEFDGVDSNGRNQTVFLHFDSINAPTRNNFPADSGYTGTYGISGIFFNSWNPTTNEVLINSKIDSYTFYNAGTDNRHRVYLRFGFINSDGVFSNIAVAEEVANPNNKGKTQLWATGDMGQELAKLSGTSTRHRVTINNGYVCPTQGFLHGQVFGRKTIRFYINGIIAADLYADFSNYMQNQSFLAPCAEGDVITWTGSANGGEWYFLPTLYRR